jgi:hypothetical protein
MSQSTRRGSSYRHEQIPKRKPKRVTLERVAWLNRVPTSNLPPEFGLEFGWRVVAVQKF